jgi:hypothetical protein
MTSSQDKKLTLVIRLESDCLGPTGDDLIDDFCILAQKELGSLYTDSIHCDIMPRHDKALPEMGYYINNKRLDSEKATKYLKLLGHDLADIETSLEDKLAGLINVYLGY